MRDQRNDIGGQGSKSQIYDWGSMTTYIPDLRRHELVARVKWFINMRWLAILACAVGALAAFLQIIPAELNPVHFGLTALFLTAANLVYIFIGRNLFGDKTRHHELQVLLGVQMLADFTALSFLTYAAGCIETPITTLFMTHIILATLFFDRNRSIVIVGAAWFFASLPLVLEWAGVVPVLSIFDGRIKDMVISRYEVTLGFVLASGATFFICWYLVSEISRSLKLRELQLEETHRLLIEMDREKTQATLRATHELKAPFAAIKSYVYTLRDGYAGVLPEKAQNMVSRIGERCDQLTSKITDIIHLSNLRTLVVTDMNFVRVDLVALIADEAREGALIGKQRQVQVVDLTEGAPAIHIMGSPVHLKTLFSNLIQNAVNYSHLGEGRVEVLVERRTKKVVVTVSDNGIGIPEEHLTKIFNEHFRCKNAVAHHPNGTGLGLPIVKEIVRLHGAVIELDSAVGKGSCFRVSFDLAEAKHERGDHG